MSKIVEYYGALYEVTDDTTHIATDGNGMAYAFTEKPELHIPHYASGSSDEEDGYWTTYPKGCWNYMGVVLEAKAHWKNSLKEV